MKQIIKQNEITIDDITLPIQGSKNMGCYVEILERLKCQFDAMLSHHCKIIVIRFDLHLNEHSPNNKLLSKFVCKLRKKLQSHYDFKRMGYVWAREQETSKQQHYHFALILDGNKVQQPSLVLDIVKSCWAGWGQPNPWVPKNCYYRITREADFADVFYRCSYLAKTRGKGYKSPTANDYSSSRINLKPYVTPTKHQQYSPQGYPMLQ